MIRNLSASDLDEIKNLAEAAALEGFRFLDRLVFDLEHQSVSLDSAGEFFLGFVLNNRIVGIGGLTPDPYANDPLTGRLRHLYVHPQHRRMTIGRRLVREIEARADLLYSTLRLRTDTKAAAKFYEGLGYRRVDDVTATHVRRATQSAASSAARDV